MTATVKDRLITSTIELIASNGVAGTGIAELLEHAKVSRRSVYLHFPGGKSELVEKAARAVGRTFDAILTSLMESAPVTSSLGDFGALWGANLKRSNFAMGCPVAAAVLGRTDAPEAAEVARSTMAGWIDRLAARLEKDGVPATECRPLATTIVAAVEGAVLLCQAEQSVDPLDHVIDNLTRLVAAASVPAA